MRKLLTIIFIIIGLAGHGQIVRPAFPGQRLGGNTFVTNRATGDTTYYFFTVSGDTFYVSNTSALVLIPALQIDTSQILNYSPGGGTNYWSQQTKWYEPVDMQRGVNLDSALYFQDTKILYADVSDGEYKFGERSFEKSTGSLNVGIGYLAGLNNTTGSNNNFIGWQAGGSNTTGNDNVALGNSSLSANSTGNRNISLGTSAGGSSLSHRNIFIGSQAGYSWTDSCGLFIHNHNGIGVLNDTLDNLIHGRFDRMHLRLNGTLAVKGQVRLETLSNNASPDTVVVTSGGLLYKKKFAAGSSNWTASTLWYSPNDTSKGVNVSRLYGNGHNLLRFTTTSQYLGYESGRSANADYNIFLGSYSGYTNTNGDQNTYLGYQSGYKGVGCSFNTMIGMRAGYWNLGSYNTHIGFQSGYNSETSNYNTIVGYNAGYSLTNGSNNLLLGNYAGKNLGATSYKICLNSYGDRGSLANDSTLSVFWASQASTTALQSIRLNGNVTIPEKLTVGGDLNSWNDCIDSAFISNISACSPLTLTSSDNITLNCDTLKVGVIDATEVTGTPKITGRIIVGPEGDYATLEEAIDSLTTSMTGETEIFLDNGVHVVSDSIVVDLPYTLSIRGAAFDLCTVKPGAGLTNKTMFRLRSQVNFERITFANPDVAAWGNDNAEDYIRAETNEFYFEVKDFEMDGGHDAINLLSGCELFVFDAIFTDVANCGIKVSAADTTDIDVEVVTFDNCMHGICLQQGLASTFLINACRFNDCDTALRYNPAAYSVDTSNTFITNNYWDNKGNFIYGFDFTRTDGRDKNVQIDYNAGYESKLAHAKINVADNASTTTVTSAGTYYKAVFTNGTTYTCKFTLTDNKALFQSDYGGDCVMMVSCNVSVNQNNRNITAAIVKNGQNLSPISPMTTRCATSGQAYASPTLMAYLSDVKRNDYFEVYVTSANSGDVVTLQDVQIFIYQR